MSNDDKVMYWGTVKTIPKISFFVNPETGEHPDFSEEKVREDPTLDFVEKPYMCEKHPEKVEQIVEYDVRKISVEFLEEVDNE